MWKYRCLRSVHICYIFVCYQAVAQTSQSFYHLPDIMSLFSSVSMPLRFSRHLYSDDLFRRSFVRDQTYRFKSQQLSHQTFVAVLRFPHAQLASTLKEVYGICIAV